MTTRPSMLLAVAALGLLVACSTTSSTRDARPAGFLGDYSQLTPGEGEQAQLIYVDPSFRVADYDAILIDPVTVWRSKDRDMADVPEKELKQLADRLEQVLRQELSADWKLVDRPGPGVMRLRGAITEAKGARVVMNVVSSMVPQMRVVSAGKKLATGTHAFVGRAGVEAEMLDSLSNERLFAAVDERAGTKAMRDGVGTWSDAEAAFAHWATRLRERLQELRAGG